MRKLTDERRLMLEAHKGASAVQGQLRQYNVYANALQGHNAELHQQLQPALTTIQHDTPATLIHNRRDELAQS